MGGGKFRPSRGRPNFELFFQIFFLFYVTLVTYTFSSVVLCTINFPWFCSPYSAGYDGGPIMLPVQTSLNYLKVTYLASVRSLSCMYTHMSFQ